ncbi:protease inhibitor I9 family protein [Janthinobacterium sp. 1_2014MBL_MicDiv]|uniref:protease inhibitor I9 family protein n=1 Tax=Janthinobacterium sp. 1_2014MBL_MicDiv TaxID=1644131 RepID=UPI0009F6A510|nr:protease inhibitor I9 family protein [Janthinobacterium sp. 1_2014MBL_MicDiv]
MPSKHWILAAIAGVSSMAGAAQADQHKPAQQARHAYIVQLTDAPLASYTGGVAGLAPTLVQGRRLNTGSEAARRYTAYLEERQRAVLALVAKAPVQYRYTVTLNGFAAMLTPDEVARLRASPDVAQVSLSTIEYTHGDGGNGNGRQQATPQDQR